MYLLSQKLLHLKVAYNLKKKRFLYGISGNNDPVCIPFFYECTVLNAWCYGFSHPVHLVRPNLGQRPQK